MNKNQIDDAPAHGVATYEAHTASKGKRSIIAWSLALAMLAWALHLFISYSFVEWHCQNTDVMTHSTAKRILHGFTAVLAVVAFACTALCIKAGRHMHQADDPVGARRQRFMLRFATLLSAFLGAAIAVQSLPNLLVDLC